MRKSYFNRLKTANTDIFLEFYSTGKNRSRSKDDPIEGKTDYTR